MNNWAEEEALIIKEILYIWRERIHNRAAITVTKKFFFSLCMYVFTITLILLFLVLFQKFLYAFMFRKFYYMTRPLPNPYRYHLSRWWYYHNLQQHKRHFRIHLLHTKRKTLLCKAVFLFVFNGSILFPHSRRVLYLYPHHIRQNRSTHTDWTANVQSNDANITQSGKYICQKAFFKHTVVLIQNSTKQLISFELDVAAVTNSCC